MEVSRLGVQSERQLPAYSTATRDLSYISDLHHGAWQLQILNPLSGAGIEPATSRFLVGFVSTAPGRELLETFYHFIHKTFHTHLQEIFNHTWAVMVRI